MDWLGERGVDRVASVGLCSGAFWSFHAALQDDRIRAIALLNPALFYWDDERALNDDRALSASSRAWRVFTTPSKWRRAIHRGSLDTAGQVVHGLRLRALHRSGSGLPDRKVLEAFDRLRSGGVSTCLVFSGGDLGIAYLRRRLGEGWRSKLRERGVEVTVIDGPNHTFTPVWSHEVLRRHLEDHLRSAGFFPGG